jgi:hypothetical protein
MAAAFQCDRCLGKFEGAAPTRVTLTQSLASQTKTYELCQSCFDFVSSFIVEDAKSAAQAVKP